LISVGYNRPLGRTYCIYCTYLEYEEEEEEEEDEISLLIIGKKHAIGEMVV
jgi:hypothetical protein